MIDFDALIREHGDVVVAGDNFERGATYVLRDGMRVFVPPGWPRNGAPQDRYRDDRGSACRDLREVRHLLRARRLSPRSRELLLSRPHLAARSAG
jgi:hypothetical protein